MIKFFSFFGTIEHSPSNYYMEDGQEQRFEVTDCCYVQEALIRILKQKGIDFDEVVVFTTEDSYAKNWIDNAYKKDAVNRPGLKKVLEDMFKDSPVAVKNVNVPAGDSQEELWVLFETMLNEIDEGDHIILDITHSFRFFPVLAFIVLSFARITKKCEIKGIFYGAMGSRAGDAGQTAQIHIPIFDLTPSVELFDWFFRVIDINHEGWMDHTERIGMIRQKLDDFLNKAVEIIQGRLEGTVLTGANPMDKPSKPPKRMFLIFSHRLTDMQKHQAETELGIEDFVYLPENLSQKWSNVPPDIETLDEYLYDLLVWLDENSSEGDYVLVQGDYGATFMVVTYCLKRKLIPVYATTRRVVRERNEGGKVITVREFEHVDFRRYKGEER